MKKVILMLVVLTTLFSCSKDDNVAGVDLSGNWVESGSTANPPVIWKFSNGTVMMNSTKKGDYSTSDNRMSVKSIDGNTYTYEVAGSKESLSLNGISNNFTVNSDLKSNYSFKKYISK
jgi:glycine/serine hydroxymethyltransferase